jgi:hypothetical protein
MSGTRSVVSFDARSSRSPDRRGSGCDTAVSPIAHPFATFRLLVDEPRGPPQSDILRYRHAPLSQGCVRLPSLDPPVAPRTPFDASEIDEPEMRTTDFCPIPRINRAPCIRVVSAPSTPFGARTGADGVSRRRCALRWSRLSLERALSSRRVGDARATSDTSVALRTNRRAKTDSLRIA